MFLKWLGDADMASKRLYFFIILILSLALITAGCSKSNSNEITGNSVAADSVTILKDSSCGCCDVYVSYMGKKGFNVNTETTNMESVKEKYGIPASMQSCHTTLIGNYFVEGHVPAEAISKLMMEKPDIKGIAMPGMPSGSPGMPGPKYGPFVVYAVNKDGSTSEFMRI